MSWTWDAPTGVFKNHWLSARIREAAVADSLFIIVSSYEKLGMQDLAGDARRILEENYPDAAQPKGTKKRFFFF